MSAKISPPVPTSVPIVGWYAPLAWPRLDGASGRFEWLMPWHYVQHVRRVCGPWDMQS